MKDEEYKELSVELLDGLPSKYSRYTPAMGGGRVHHNYEATRFPFTVRATLEATEEGACMRGRYELRLIEGAEGFSSIFRGGSEGALDSAAFEGKNKKETDVTLMVIQLTRELNSAIDARCWDLAYFVDRGRDCA